VLFSSRTSIAATAPLRIAFLAPEDRQTGTYFRSHNLARALIQLGHEVTVYSQSNIHRGGVTREDRDGVSYVLMPSSRGNRFLISPVNPVNIARRLLFNVASADVYHLFQPFPSAAIAWLALRERRPGLFAYDWDDYWMTDEFGLKNPRGLNAFVTSLWVRFLERYLPGKSDLLSTLSHKIADLAHRLLARRTAIIYNGVWPEPPMPRPEARRALGLQPDALYAGLMGWSGEMDWAFAALRSSLQTVPHLRIAACGQDPGRVLQQFPDVADRVDVLGYISAEKLLAFRSSVDLGLIPMRVSEFNEYRLPYKLTDFLAAGTPVLASAIGETGILAGKLPGIIACPPDRDAFIRHFQETITDFASMTEPPRIPTDQLLERFHWNRVAGALVDAYRQAGTLSATAPGSV